MRQADFSTMSAIPLISVAALLSFPAGDHSSVQTAIDRRGLGRCPAGFGARVPEGRPLDGQVGRAAQGFLTGGFLPRVTQGVRLSVRGGCST